MEYLIEYYLRYNQGENCDQKVLFFLLMGEQFRLYWSIKDCFLKKEKSLEISHSRIDLDKENQKVNNKELLATSL
jgi:hypothetical protein